MEKIKHEKMKEQTIGSPLLPQNIGMYSNQDFLLCILHHPV
jgi:hypothetical protein